MIKTIFTFWSFANRKSKSQHRLTFAIIVKANFTTDNSLQSFLLHIRNNLDENAAVTFVNSKDNCFARGSPTTFAAHTSGTEIRFIDFNFASRKLRSAFTFLSDPLPDFQINLFDRLISQIAQLSSFVSSQIKGKILNDLTGFALRNFSIPIISV